MFWSGWPLNSLCLSKSSAITRLFFFHNDRIFFTYGGLRLRCSTHGESRRETICTWWPCSTAVFVLLFIFFFPRLDGDVRVLLSKLGPLRVVGRPKGPSLADQRPVPVSGHRRGNASFLIVFGVNKNPCTTRVRCVESCRRNDRNRFTRQIRNERTY